MLKSFTPERVIERARTHIGDPFMRHPSGCGSSEAADEQCRRIGVTSAGYDCIGFVIATFCELHNKDVTKWPIEYRHSFRRLALPTPRLPRFGDVVFIKSLRPGTDTLFPTHTAFYIEPTNRGVEVTGAGKYPDQPYDMSMRLLHIDGENGIRETGIRGTVCEVTVVDADALHMIASRLPGINS